MNHLKTYLTCLLTTASMLNIGCVSSVTDHARSAYKSVKREIQGRPGTSEIDALYAQVRPEDRHKVNNLNHTLEVTRETEKLTELENSRDSLQRDRSKVNAKCVDYLAQETECRVELAKLEAIDRNRLGDRVTNIERIADMHVDALEAQQKRLQFESEVSILDIKIAELQSEITKQKEHINNLQNDTRSRG